MSSDRLLSRARDSAKITKIDRLALSRAQHFQSRENRSESDDEVDGVSDWSDSDRECCPLSDFECYEEEQMLLPQISHSHIIETALPVITDSNTSTRISFGSNNDKPKDHIYKKSSGNSKQNQAPLLPARRAQRKDVSSGRTTTTTNSQLSYIPRYRKAAAPSSPTRLYSRRETTCTSLSSNTHLSKDSINSSFHSQDERQIFSPNLSHTSAPRVYEMKRTLADDSHYGRLLDATPTRPTRAQSRQKWGTIVHPPFPLGYQHVTPEQVTQVVERLSSPVRCRERHTPVQTASRRYLSVEQTDALVRNPPSSISVIELCFLDQSINQSQNSSNTRSILACAETIEIRQNIESKLESCWNISIRHLLSELQGFIVRACVFL